MCYEGSMTQQSSPTAKLDPWLLTESRRLFGYAPTHPRLGGKSWICTSPIVRMVPGYAVTVSGTVFHLGTNVADVSKLPEEGQVAYRALVERDYTTLDAMWLTACKIARWLDVAPPTRDEDDVNAFMTLHMARYYSMLHHLGGLKPPPIVTH